MSDTEMKEEPAVKEEVSSDTEMKHDDNDIVNTNSEMVLDDILGDDIIGESSDQETTEKGRKKILAPGKTRTRSNSYASDLSSTASISKRNGLRATLDKTHRKQTVPDSVAACKPDWQKLDARYFVIKSNNMDNVEISMERSVWATPRRNESMLVEAFRHTKHVILIFSVRESGAFQGVARMMSMPRPNKGEVNWVIGSTPVLRLLPNYFKIQWLDKSALEFAKTAHLKNRWNEYKQVKISRDGQEIEPTVAAELCSLWPNCEDPEAHLPIIPSSSSPSTSRVVRREEPISDPSEVKTTYSSYKDNNYRRASPEPYSDEEPAPPGISRSSRPEGDRRTGEDRKRRDNRPARRPEPRRADNRPSGAAEGGRRQEARPSRYREERGNRREAERRQREGPSRDRRRSRSPNERRSGGDRGGGADRGGAAGGRESAKDILLHGSYLDYVREYQSQQSRLAALLQDPVLRQDIFNAAQLAANTTSSKGGSSSSSSSRKRKEEKYLDSRAHSALVDEFLSTHSNNRR